MKKILPILCFTLLPTLASAQTLKEFIKQGFADILLYRYTDAVGDCPFESEAANEVIVGVIS
tara:strand:- start:461 stop:646 length:186 start_codon:yes stop_codon:yes gene_type:complete